MVISSQVLKRKYTYLVLTSPWNVTVGLTFRAMLIYETHACFFMTCLIAFSAIGGA